MIKVGFNLRKAHRAWVRLNKWQLVTRREVRFVMKNQWKNQNAEHESYCRGRSHQEQASLCTEYEASGIPLPAAVVDVLKAKGREAGVEFDVNPLQ